MRYNAGAVGEKSAAAANFYYKENTGYIIEFSNRPTKRPGIGKGTLVLLQNMKKFPKTKFGLWYFKKFKKKCPKIIDLSIPKKTTQEARLNLKLSIKMYNKMRD